MVNILVAKPNRSAAMRVLTDDGYVGTMHSTPSAFTFKEIPNFGTIEREGKKAITRLVSPGLKQLSFTQTVASPDYQESIEPVVQRFANFGSKGMRVRFTGGSGAFEQHCWWLIKDLAVNVTQRARNNEPSRTTISWTLEEWVDVRVAGIRPPPAKPKTAAASRSAKAASVASISKAQPRKVQAPARTHRVASGDTLWHIAQRHLGDGERWREIFNMNREKIGNPNLIFPGQVLRIPG